MIAIKIPEGDVAHVARGEPISWLLVPSIQVQKLHECWDLVPRSTSAGQRPYRW